MEDAFESIAEHFKESIAALKAANPEIETNFRRIDANHFSAKIYMGGKEKARCRIWFGGRTSLMGGILYSTSDLGDNSYNDSLSVADNGYSLFLKPSGMAYRAGAGKEQLDPREAAEYYWDGFIEPLRH